MTITEQFICGKHTAADCEDGIVITNDFAAVIDGSTSKTPKRLDPSMKNGRFAMLLISEYIKQMPADYTMNNFCRGITLRIAEQPRTGIRIEYFAQPIGSTVNSQYDFCHC